MEYGDVAFVGNGPDGPVPIGLEHKRIGDVLACINDGRFAARQLPGLLDSYAHVWLLVEGAFRAGAEGQLLVADRRGRFGPVPGRRKEWMYRHLAHWLLSIQIQGGCRVVVARDKRESAVFIKALFTWWTAKTWDEHETLHTLDNVLHRRLGYCRPSYARKVAAVFPGVGWERSAAAASHFKTVENMVLASAEEWAEVDGIGPVTARKVRNAIKGKL